jgi:hypothetical protein
MLDFAFAISYFVCLVLLWIFGMNHLNAVWRITLGLGCVPPLFLLYFRLKMHEVSTLSLSLEGADRVARVVCRTLDEEYSHSVSCSAVRLNRS